VPNGASVPGTPLRLARAPAGQLDLTWSASCVSSDTDFEVYEGTLGDFVSHAPLLCDTGGATNATITPAAGSAYYLIVPTNGFREGSYGTNSAGQPRTQGVAACLPQSVGVCK
jgi:hypothetical protein